MLVPESVSVPAPFLTISPVPEITPVPALLAPVLLIVKRSGQNYANPIVLTANRIFQSNNFGNIDFESTVSGIANS